MRLAEVLAALSLTSDLGSGVTFEKGLWTCLVAQAFGESLELGLEQQRDLFQASLLRALGCTAYSPETAALVGDDNAFQRALKTLDHTDPGRFVAEFGLPADHPAAGRLGAVAQAFHVTGREGARSACEVSASLGASLGLSPSAITALDEVYERWDGSGVPEGHSGEQLTLTARILHVAEQAAIAAAAGGPQAVAAELRHRAGTHLDPALCEAFISDAEALLAPLAEPDALAAVVAAEPPPAVTVDAKELEAMCLALAIYTDLKGLDLLGHSPAVAALARAAGVLAGLEEEQARELYLSGLLHDLGRTAISSEIWNRPSGLAAADLERVRLHPYWTDRILARCPALADLAPTAAAHHERLDASGYHRGTSAGELPPAARLLAAADVFTALTEERAHRPALSGEEAAQVLLSEAAAGRLDGEAAAAVITASGLPRPRTPWPMGLTDREVEVLRLCARGLTNQQIADRLVVSARTVQHHLAHIYDKTGRRTRSGVAVLAVERGLVGGSPAG